MTAMTGGGDCAPARLAATRACRHRVAEYMPACALDRAAGQSGLVRSPGGFRAPSLGTDAALLAVDGTERAVSGAAGTKRAPVITVRAAAGSAEVTPGAPAGVSVPAAPPGLDAPLMTGSGAARLLAEWHGTRVPSRFAAGSAGGKPAGLVLWPEYCGDGRTAAAITFSTWPGDGHLTDPYPCAGPPDGPPPGHPAFRNAPFGAVRIFGQAGTVAEAAAFFGDGRARSRPWHDHPTGRTS